MSDKDYVLDTSAVIAFSRDEDGSQTVAQLISDAQRHDINLWISFVTMTELYYTIYRREGKDIALETMSLFENFPVHVVQSYPELSLSAGHIKANHRLSLADAFVAATALAKQAILVHKDPEFDSIATLVKAVALPLKKHR